MMSRLEPSERAFVEKRAGFAKSWPPVGLASIGLLLGLAAWLWLSAPVLVDPWFVLDGLESGAFSEGTIRLMAAMLPVVVLLCLLVVLVSLLLAFAVFSNERRLIALIRRLLDG